jgi:hypothetical protein
MYIYIHTQTHTCLQVIRPDQLLDPPPRTFDLGSLPHKHEIFLGQLRYNQLLGTESIAAAVGVGIRSVACSLQSQFELHSDCCVVGCPTGSVLRVATERCHNAALNTGVKFSSNAQLLSRSMYTTNPHPIIVPSLLSKVLPCLKPTFTRRTSGSSLDVLPRNNKCSVSHWTPSSTQRVCYRPWLVVVSLSVIQYYIHLSFLCRAISPFS